MSNLCVRLVRFLTVASLTYGWAIILAGDIEVTPPAKPPSIPTGAFWRGGADGGVWIFIVKVENDRFLARIFHDSGYPWLEGWFGAYPIFERRKLKRDDLVEQLSGFDGERLFVRNSTRVFQLEPMAESKSTKGRIPEGSGSAEDAAVFRNETDEELWLETNVEGGRTTRIIQPRDFCEIGSIRSGNIAVTQMVDGTPHTLFQSRIKIPSRNEPRRKLSKRRFYYAVFADRIVENKNPRDSETRAP
jgi:hypothetical protein